MMKQYIRITKMQVSHKSLKPFSKASKQGIEKNFIPKGCLQKVYTKHHAQL